GSGIQRVNAFNDGGSHCSTRKLVARIVLIDLPVEGELDIVSGYRGAVPESGFSEHERVGQPVLRDLPLLRDRRLDLEAGRCESDERLIDVYPDLSPSDSTGVRWVERP